MSYCKGLTEYPPGPSTCSAKGGKNGQGGARTGGVGTWRAKESRGECVQRRGGLENVFRLLSAAPIGTRFAQVELHRKIDVCMQLH